MSTHLPSLRRLSLPSRLLLNLLASIWLAAAAAAAQLPVDRLTEDPALSGPAAKGVQVSPDGQRVGFLRARPDNQNQLDLWVFERASGQSRRLIDSASLGPATPLSAVEQDRRERERTAQLSGIVNWQWSPDGQQLLFAVGDKLHLARIDADGVAKTRVIATGSDLIDPRLSPKGHYVSFVRGQNLQVLDLRNGRTRALTRDGGGTVHNAESEFVAQEEMDQPRGYWWAPDESAIAFTRFDESPVPAQRRFEIQAQRTDVVEQRYPITGGPNVSLKLGLVSLGDSRVRWIDLGPERDIYLPRVDWLPDSRSLSFQRQSRDQKSLELLRTDTRSLKTTLILREQADTWVELHQDLRFLKQQPAFIWAGDRNGRKHLELVSLDGRQRRALTRGDWQVDELLAVDETAGLVYLAGDTGTSLERHVFAVKLDGSNADKPQRISRSPGWHQAAFAEDASRVELFVDTFSDPSTPPQTRILAADGSPLAWIEENRLDAGHPYAPYLDHHVTPEFGLLNADDGQRLNYSVLKPPGFDPAKRYPVLLSVYGGPQVQEVQRQWGDLFEQAMAQSGIVVFKLDNRGSARRGRAFSDPIHGRLGDVEVRDQLRGVAWLKGQPWVDTEHIGVFGWSYGGYMSLMLLATSPDKTFAAGISGAPVTRFELYDTHYTERYLGTPQANPKGYQQTSVFSHLDGLRRAPLLLIHGMADDNVLFTNSTELMAAMQTQGIAFRMMTYPGGKHGLSTPAMTRHSRRLIADYLHEMLQPRPASAR
jgi:dipeptidyl-peptidase-4